MALCYGLIGYNSWRSDRYASEGEGYAAKGLRSDLNTGLTLHQPTHWNFWKYILILNMMPVTYLLSKQNKLGFTGYRLQYHDWVWKGGSPLCQTHNVWRILLHGLGYVVLLMVNSSFANKCILFYLHFLPRLHLYYQAFPNVPLHFVLNSSFLSELILCSFTMLFSVFLLPLAFSPSPWYLLLCVLILSVFTAILSSSSYH